MPRRGPCPHCGQQCRLDTHPAACLRAGGRGTTRGGFGKRRSLVDPATGRRRLPPESNPSTYVDPSGKRRRNEEGSRRNAESVRARREARKSQENSLGGSSSLPPPQHHLDAAPLPEPHALVVDSSGVREVGEVVMSSSASYYQAQGYSAVPPGFPAIQYSNADPGAYAIQSAEQQQQQQQQQQDQAHHMQQPVAGDPNAGSSSNDLGMQAVPGSLGTPGGHDDMITGPDGKRRRGRPSGAMNKGESQKSRARELSEHEFKLVVEYFATAAANYEAEHPEDPRGFLKKNNQFSGFASWIFETVKALKAAHPEVSDLHPSTLKGVGCAQFPEYKEAMSQVIQERSRRRKSGRVSENDGASGGEGQSPMLVPPALPTTLQPHDPSAGSMVPQGAYATPVEMPAPGTYEQPPGHSLPTHLHHGAAELPDALPVDGDHVAGDSANEGLAPGPDDGAGDGKRKRGRPPSLAKEPAKKKQRAITEEESAAIIDFYARAAEAYAAAHPNDPRGCFRDEHGAWSGFTPWAYEVAKAFKLQHPEVSDVHPGSLKSIGCAQFPEYKEAMHATIGRARAGRRVGDELLEGDEAPAAEPEPLPESTLVAIAAGQVPPGAGGAEEERRAAAKTGRGRGVLADDEARFVEEYFVYEAAQYAEQHPEDPRGCFKKDGEFSVHAPWLSEVIKKMNAAQPQLEAYHPQLIKTIGCQQFPEYAEAVLKAGRKGDDIETEEPEPAEGAYGEAGYAQHQQPYQQLQGYEYTAAAGQAPVQYQVEAEGTAGVYPPQSAAEAP